MSSRNITYHNCTIRTAVHASEPALDLPVTAPFWALFLSWVLIYEMPVVTRDQNTFLTHHRIVFLTRAMEKFIGKSEVPSGEGLLFTTYFGEGEKRMAKSMCSCRRGCLQATFPSTGEAVRVYRSLVLQLIFFCLFTWGRISYLPGNLSFPSVVRKSVWLLTWTK